MVQTSLFFYGTLMHPKILKRVIRNDGAHLQSCSALLLVSRLIQADTLFTPCNCLVIQEFTRHKVKVRLYVLAA